MSSRSLAAVFFVLMLGLFFEPRLVFAQKHKVFSCQLSSQGSYTLSGAFLDPYSSERLERKGLSLGTGCAYTHRWFGVAAGAEVYLGKFRIEHEELGLNGSFYFDELSTKQWGKVAFFLDSLELGLKASLGQSVTSRLVVEDLYLDAGGGWLNLELFAERQMLSQVDLKIWEVEAGLAYPVSRRLSLTFSLLWQKYDVDLRIDFKRYGQKVLAVLDFDLNQKKDIVVAQDLFYLTPGVKWCKERGDFCVAATIPWGVFHPDAWSLGGTLGVEWKY